MTYAQSQYGMSRTDRHAESSFSSPSPGDILRLLGHNIVWQDWRSVFEASWYEDQVPLQKVRPLRAAVLRKHSPVSCDVGGDDGNRVEEFEG